MFWEDESKTETGLIYFIENMFFDFFSPFVAVLLHFFGRNVANVVVCVCGTVEKTLLILGRHLFILVK